MASTGARHRMWLQLWILMVREHLSPAPKKGLIAGLHWTENPSFLRALGWTCKLSSHPHWQPQKPHLQPLPQREMPETSTSYCKRQFSRETSFIHPSLCGLSNVLSFSAGYEWITSSGNTARWVNQHSGMSLEMKLVWLTHWTNAAVTKRLKPWNRYPLVLIQGGLHWCPGICWTKRARRLKSPYSVGLLIYLEKWGESKQSGNLALGVAWLKFLLKEQY